ncbi:histidine kinase [Aeromicrobium sp.]|uniref:sensor histidine kinase n=1 Tax=Aeromicrobium sp. TaxID=1871063 RepID=UPI00199A3271|nr:histidine kinase [Aeromicrobium sp.]MBC7633252.1 hypothetical protein [Aeromicrobium sp.]
MITGVVVASSVAPSALPGSPELGLRTLLLGLVVVSIQALVLIRTGDVPRFALVAVSILVPVAAGAGLGIATGGTSVAVFIAAYAVVVDTRWPRPASTLAVAMLIVGLGDLIRATRDDGWAIESLGSAALQGITTVGVGAVLGALVGARRETTRARVGQQRAVAGEQAALTQAAVARERVAMARELHDIAAHHLSGIAVMTAALDRQIDTDPAGAKTAVRQVRQQSTAMLRDLRSLVALLREDDAGRAGPEVGPDVGPETLQGIPTLVETARLAGRDVALSIFGAPAAQIPLLSIGPLAQLAAYRTVQESLVNAARHAPGSRSEVVVDVRDPSEVTIVVRNDAPPAPAPSTPLVSTGAGNGFGIVGMQERADLTDARLSAGPAPGGGWVVRLDIPVDTMEDPL